VRSKAVIGFEYIDDGKRVIIPVEVWEALKELASIRKSIASSPLRFGRSGISKSKTTR
jgi:hypothetical protein